MPSRAIPAFSRAVEKDNQRENRASTGEDIRYDATPIDVPSMFVIMSVVPDWRIGRNACRISMVMLTLVPSAMVAVAARFGRRIEDHHA
jgi:hypothetical protein